MLGVALVFVTAFRRLGLGATLGYIVAGALIGPSVLGLFREPEAIQGVSEIGIALLLFIVGLSFSRVDFGGCARIFSDWDCCRWCCAASPSVRSSMSHWVSL